jgi:hypothetical protein
MAAHIDDQDYVERKRLQISRFFEKISKRKELVEHPDFIHFLSNDMVKKKEKNGGFEYKYIKHIQVGTHRRHALKYRRAFLFKVQQSSQA